jgi:hypothetical protein
MKGSKKKIHHRDTADAERKSRVRIFSEYSHLNSLLRTLWASVVNLYFSEPTHGTNPFDVTSLKAAVGECVC